jgi:hypothetical protein
MENDYQLVLSTNFKHKLKDSLSSGTYTLIIQNDEDITKITINGIKLYNKRKEFPTHITRTIDDNSSIVIEILLRRK